MVAFYFILGVLVAIVGFLVGMITGNFFIAIIIGLGAGAVLFGIGIIIENQQTLMAMLQENTEKLPEVKYDQITCDQCHKTYDENRKSCPYCGSTNRQA